MAGFQMPDFGSLGAAFGAFGAAGADAATQQGYYNAAHKYTEAGNIEADNARISRASGEIQKLQEQRELYKVQSASTAAAGGAGIATRGSMLDLIRGSAQQGALRVALTGAQEQIDINAHDAQMTAYYAESDQATAQGNAAGARSSSDMMSGIAGIAGFLAPLAMGFL